MLSSVTKVIRKLLIKKRNKIDFRRNRKDFNETNGNPSAVFAEKQDTVGANARRHREQKVQIVMIQVKRRSLKHRKLIIHKQRKKMQLLVI